MWKVVLDGLEVLGWIALGVGAVMAFVFAILFCKAIIQCAIAEDEVRKLNEETDELEDYW